MYMFSSHVYFLSEFLSTRVFRGGGWAAESDSQARRPGFESVSSHSRLCDLEQDTSLLCAVVSSFGTVVHGVVMKIS